MWVRLATVLDRLATYRRIQGRYGQARWLHRHALALAGDMTALVAILDAQGKQDEAEQLLRGALGVLETRLGPEHHEVAVTLNNLGALLYATGRYDQARQCYLRALAIKERVLGPRHPELATTLNNRAPGACGRHRYRATCGAGSCRTAPRSG